MSNEKASEGGFGSFFFSLPSGVKILLHLLKVFGSNVRMCLEIQTILGIFTNVN
jgi:hypothetical protein